MQESQTERPRARVSERECVTESNREGMRGLGGRERARARETMRGGG